MPSAEASVGAVIVAAGSGSRLGDGGPRKQYRDLRGYPILAWAIAAFLDHPRVSRTVVVLPAEDLDSPFDWLKLLPVQRVAGGATRNDSVRAGLEVLDGVDRVLVHDGARPLVDRALIDRVLATEAGSCVVPGLPLTDTVKQVEGDRVLATAPRERLWRIQTPQCFPWAVLLDAHRRAAQEGITSTDDAGLLERYGHTVRVVEGSPMNLKVTTLLDLRVVEALAGGLPPPTRS